MGKDNLYACVFTIVGWDHKDRANIRFNFDQKQCLANPSYGGEWLIFYLLKNLMLRPIKSLDLISLMN